jgi:hypothetical protein
MAAAVLAPISSLFGSEFAGCKIFSYLAGTTTKTATYADNTGSLGTTLTNPIVLNSNGAVPTGVWISPNILYKFGLYPATEVDDPPSSSALLTLDNIFGTKPIASTVAKTTAYTLTLADNGKAILVDATAGAVVITGLAASTAGNGFTFSLKKIAADLGTNTVTFTPHSGDLVDNAATFVISNAAEGYIFVCDGTSWHVQTRMSPTVLFSVVRQIFTATGTYTPTTNMTYCIAEAQAGGGAGGATQVSGAGAGGGGGAGGYGIARLTAAQIGASKAVTIGGGGTGSVSSSGGTTSLGALLVVTGGTVGGTDVGSAGNLGTLGGAGGTCTTGENTSVTAERGGIGFHTGTALSISGQGGSSKFGGGGSGKVTAAAGTAVGGNATGYGAGGGGGAASATPGADVFGGDGTGGIIIVTEYCFSYTP